MLSLRHTWRHIWVAALLAFMLGAVLPRPAAAQGTIQIRVLTVPPQLPNPFVEDLAQAYQQGQYPVQIVFSAPSLQAQEMRIRVELERDGQTLFQTVSTPVSIRPGVQTLNRLQDLPGLRFDDSLIDLVDQIGDADLREQIRRTGALPEGSYTLTIEALPDDPFITSIPSTSVFLVQFAQPPVILTPADGATVTQTYPIFGWTPVIGPTTQPIAYDLLLVELLPGQTPQQALDANRAYVEQSVQATSFAYTPRLLPLTPGRTYVWQITARDPAGRLPISDGGRTPIQTFRYEDPTQPGESLAALESIVLEPGFARLVDLDVEATEEATAYRLNGEATLELTFDRTVTVDARLQDLEIQKTGLDQPTVLGGAVGTTLRDVEIPLGPNGDIAAVADLEWGFGDGFTARADIQIPGASTIEASGELRITQSGAVGTLVAEDDAGLVQLGVDPVELTATRLEAQLPSGQLRATGSVRFFGTSTPGARPDLSPQPDRVCLVDNVDISGVSGDVAIRCDANTSIPLIKGSSRFVVSLGTVTGTLGVDAAQAADRPALSYDLDVQTGFRLPTTDGQSCGARAVTRVSSADGVQVGEGTTTCVGNGTIDAGLVKIQISDLRAEQLAYQNGTWDAALSLDAFLSIPALNVVLPEIEDITIDKNGITVPAQQEELSTLPDAPFAFELADFNVTVNEVDIAETTVSWASTNGTRPGAWDIGFDVDVDIPGGRDVPACLRGGALQAENFRYRDGTLSGTLSAENLTDCTWSIGPGYAVDITGVSGTLEAVSFTDDGFDGSSRVSIDGAVRVGNPFLCSTQTQTTVPLPAGRLMLTGDGLNGSITNLIPACPVEVGPFTAQVTQSTVAFDATGPSQEATFDADATLQLTGGQGVDGTFALDMTTGTFTDLNFQLRQPFTWDVPRQNPVLSFQIDQAEIGLDGFLVDGQQDLVFKNGTTQGATFDQLRIDLETQEVVSGSVFFNGGFGLQGAISPASGGGMGGGAANANSSPRTLRFEGVPVGSPLTASPGVLAELAGQIRIDSTGLHTTGRARAALDIGTWGPEAPMEVEFSPDFRMQLTPFKVAQGQADILYNGSQVAYVDAAGFHLGAGVVTAIIPDRLPLPNEQVAYLELKRNGQPIITATTQPDGRVLVETNPNETVDLVLPALDDGSGPPRIQATLQNLYVTRNGASFTYDGGSIMAQLVTPLDLNRLGIPLVLRDVAYGTPPTASTPPGLYLNGTLTLFQRELGTGADVTLAVDAVGTTTGTIDMSGLTTSIDIGGDLGRVRIAPANISGTIVVPKGGANATTDLTVDGTIEIHSADGLVSAAEVGLSVTPQAISVTRFTPTSAMQTAGAHGAVMGGIGFAGVASTPLPAVGAPSIDPAFDVAGFGVGVDAITALPLLEYDRINNTFDFRVELDARVSLAVPDGSAFEIPLTGVEVTPRGLMLPAQQISFPSAIDDQQTLSVGPIDLRLLYAEFKKDVMIDWYQQTPTVQGLDGLQISLAVLFPGLPALSGEEVTVRNAGYSDGIFTGQAIAREFPVTPPQIGFGGGTRFFVNEISGALTNDNGRQGYDIDVDGTFDLSSGPDGLFTNTPSAPGCPSADVTLSLSSAGGLEGTVPDVAKCVKLDYGPMTVTFPTSTLMVAVDAQGPQQATLNAEAEATLQGVNGQITGTGTMAFDLTTPAITSASIEINGQFDIGLPQDDPVFTLRVNQAKLTSDGIEVNGTGMLNPGDVGATVQFTDFTFNPLTPAITRGSAVIQSAFAVELPLSGTNWRLVDLNATPSGGAAVRLGFPPSLTIDAQGLGVQGQTTATVNYEGQTYASLTAEYQQFRVGFAPFGVQSGRVVFSDANTTLGYYDRYGLDFDPAGILTAILPNRIPLPDETIAYLKVKDDQGTALVNYTQNQNTGGYVLNSDLDAQGNPKPVELVLAGVDAQNPPTFKLTLDSVRTDGSFRITEGTITADIGSGNTDADFQTKYDIPLRLTRIVYEKDSQGGYALTGDGNIMLPDGLGAEQATFSGVGFTQDGVKGTIEVGDMTSFATSCSDLSMPYQPSSAVAAVAYTGTTLNPSPSPADLNAADLGIGLRAIKLELDPTGSNTFALLGDVSSRIMAQPGDAPKRIPFAAGYANDAWNAELCTGKKEGKKDKISILLAEMYLDPGNGGSATLTVTNDGKVDVSLSGTVKVPDVMGGDFEALVTDLSFGSSGITVGDISAGASAQETTLFGETLKLRNDDLDINWDGDKDALQFVMDGTVWLVPYQCDNDPALCGQGSGAGNSGSKFDGLTINTKGDVSLGNMNANLLGNTGIYVFGEGNNALVIKKMLLKKSGTDPVSLELGGTAEIPGVAPDGKNAPTSDFNVEIAADGTVSSDGVHFRFVPDPSGGDSEVDAIGDNEIAGTEFELPQYLTIDVKEAGVAFQGGSLSQPAVYANAALYIYSKDAPKEKRTNGVIRAGALGSRTATTAGVWIEPGTTPTFNLSGTAKIDSVSFGGIVGVKDLTITAQTSDRIEVTLDGNVFVSVPKVTVAAAWEGMRFTKDGLVDKGRFGNGVELRLLEDKVVVSGAFDYKPNGGNLDVRPIGATEDDPMQPIKTLEHFAVTNVNLTIGSLKAGDGDNADSGGGSGFSGGVKGVYFMRYEEGNAQLVRFAIEQAFVDAGGFTAELFLDYRKGTTDDGQTVFSLLAAGGVEIENVGRAKLGGAFSLNADGEVGFGFVANVAIDGLGVTVVPPNILTISGISGGFFFKPDEQIFALLEAKVLPTFPSIPPERVTASAEKMNKLGVNVAFFFGVNAIVIDTGTDAASVLNADMLMSIGIGSQGAVFELAIEGKVYGQEGIKVWFVANIYRMKSLENGVETVSTEINAAGGMTVTYPGPITGSSDIGFAAYSSGPEGNKTSTWVIDGNLDIDLMTVITVEGDLFVAPSGFYADLGIDASLDAGFLLRVSGYLDTQVWWKRATSNFGVYFAVGAEADVLGGAATISGDLKGAFISDGPLLYGTMKGKASAFFHKEGEGVDITVWGAISKRNGFEGGLNANSSYQAKIDAAREDARQMKEGASEAATELADARKKFEDARDEYENLDLTAEQLAPAGLELILASKAKRQTYATDMRNTIITRRRPIPFDRIASEVIEGPRPDDERPSSLELDSVDDALNELSDIFQGAETYLNGLTTRAVEWDAKALQLAANITSPVQSVTKPQYSSDSSGGSTGQIRMGSFEINDAQVQSQDQALKAAYSVSRDEVDRLYRESIEAVKENLDKLDNILTGKVGQTSSGRAVSLSVGLLKAGLYTMVLEDEYSLAAESAWSWYSWGYQQDAKFMGNTGPFHISKIRSALQSFDQPLSAFNLRVAAARRYTRYYELLQAWNARTGSVDFPDQDPNAYISALPDPLPSNKSALMQAAEETGVNLWHGSLKSGIYAIIAEASVSTQNVVTNHADVIGPVKSAHAEVTKKMDALFAIRANMSTTLYGMLEDYLAFRASQYADTTSADEIRKTQTYIDQQNDLLAEMEPPLISEVRVRKSSSGDYSARATVTVSAAHPKGVSEISYSDQDGTATGIYDFSDFRSFGEYAAGGLGLWQTGFAHAFARGTGDRTRDMSFAVRVRSPAGNVTTRSVSFSLPVSPYSPASGSGNTTETFDSDATPPTATLDVLHETARPGTHASPYNQVFLSSQAGSQQAGSQQVAFASGLSSRFTDARVAGDDDASEPLDPFTTYHWTGESNRVAFEVNAEDPETDVASYEYAIGTSPDSSDVTDGFEPAAGRRALAGENTARSNTIFRSEARGLSLDTETSYYLKVRVTNGADGQTVRSEPTPIRLDDTPPSLPGSRPDSIEYLPLDVRGNTLISDPVAMGDVPYDGYRTRTHDPYAPKATIRWNRASDDESGILTYEYVIDGCSVGETDAFADANSVQSTVETSVSLGDADGLSYFVSRCAFVRARNHADTPGPILRIGPIEPVDPSNPMAAHFRLQPTATGIRVYITRAAADRETTVRGYRYRVSKQGSGTVLRDFPTDGVDTGPLCTSSPEDGFRYLASYSGSGEIAYAPGAQSQGLTVFGLGEEMTATTSTTEPATIQPAANDTTQFPADRLQENVRSSVADPTGCVTPYSEPNAPHFVIPTDGLPKGEKLSVAIEAVNRQGLSTQTRSGAYIVLDDTPPLSPTITNVNITQFRATFDVNGVHDPESGIAEIEFAAGRNMEWTRVTNLTRPHYNSRSYLDAGGPVLLSPGGGTIGLDGQRSFNLPSEVGIRVTNTNGLRTVIWSSDQVVAQPANPYGTVQGVGGTNQSDWQVNGTLFFP